MEEKSLTQDFQFQSPVLLWRTYHWSIAFAYMKSDNVHQYSLFSADHVTLTQDQVHYNKNSVIYSRSDGQLFQSERGRRLWNCNETGVCTAVASRRVLARKGEKVVHETGGGSGILSCGWEKLPRIFCTREIITCKSTWYCPGKLNPADIPSRGASVSDLIKNPLWLLIGADCYWKLVSGRIIRGKIGPSGTLYSRSDSEWMESPNFLEWFGKLFLPAVEEMLQTGPVVLFLDGHQSRKLAENQRQIISQQATERERELKRTEFSGNYNPHLWTYIGEKYYQEYFL